ncbi:alpha/beta hydrolase [Pseudorhodoferax sp. LjRoot39]|uniref:alpha/beta fold hydrolase n=1 Tax=Pseudorhodoferax sp. LjRoot39 TaxID=3342328 RepID=UPI003ECF59FE
MTTVHTTQRHSARGAVQIAYQTEGEGPQVFILPSLGRGPADYDALAPLLAQAGFTVVRPWPRGLGASQGPMDALDLAELADDVLAVVEATGARQPVIAGHAFGNFVARTLAARHPRAVRGVALLAASAGKTPGGEPPITAELMASIYASGDLTLPAQERLAHLRRAFFAPGNDPTVWLDGWHPALKQAQGKAYAQARVEDYFNAGGVPLLDLQADEDTIAPRRYARVLQDALGSQVTVSVIARAGHALVPEQPAAVCQALVAWMRSLPPAPTTQGDSP